MAELERISQDERDVYPISFVRRAARVATAVGRVVVHGEDKWYGTGFLVAPNLVLTCHHVVANLDAAASSILELDYFEQEDGRLANVRAVAFDPAAAFVTDDELDFTLAAIAIDPADPVTLGERAVISLKTEERPLVVGAHVNIVHHAAAGPMVVSFRNGRLSDVVDSWIHYSADTEGGSAGAPVLDDRWQLVGLHHARIARPDLSSGPAHFGEAVRADAILAALVRAGHHELVAAIAGDASLPQQDDLGAPAILSDIPRRASASSARSHEIAESAGEVVDPALEQPRDSIFISYAHDDQDRVDWRERVRTFLAPIERHVKVTVWDDSLIQAGTDWRANIELGLRRARVAILLVGPKFLSSEFIQTNELPRLLAAAKAEGVVIFPIITHYAPYNLSALEPYQAFNSPERPLEDLPRAKQNRLLVQLVEKVAAIFDAGAR